MKDGLPYDITSINARALEWQEPLWNGINRWADGDQAEKERAVRDVHDAVEIAMRMALDVADKENEEIVKVQRPIVREASILRSEFDKHDRKECDDPTLRECAARLYVLARKVWPKRPPAIFKNQGRG